MTLFIDASALVAMLNGEADAAELVEQLADHDVLLWSPVVQWEAMAAVSRSTDPATLASGEVLDFGDTYGVRTVAVDESIVAGAFSAFISFGKRSGHPAQLNMGDCFAYACAKANQARLLYKGNDFAKTDLA